MTCLFAVPQHPHPLPVLGDIGQVEEDAERLRHDSRLGGIERFNAFGQSRLSPMLAGPAIPRQHADLFDEIEGLTTGQFHDHIAEHVAEEAHIAPQQFIGDQGMFFQRGGNGKTPTSISRAFFAPSRIDFQTPRHNEWPHRGLRRRFWPVAAPQRRQQEQARGRTAAGLLLDCCWIAAGLLLDCCALAQPTAAQGRMFQSQASSQRHSWVPKPSMAKLTTSPGRRNSGGLRAIPTPGGVPVVITSPASRVRNCER